MTINQAFEFSFYARYFTRGWLPDDEARVILKFQLKQEEAEDTVIDALTSMSEAEFSVFFRILRTHGQTAAHYHWSSPTFNPLPYLDALSDAAMIDADVYRSWQEMSGFIDPPDFDDGDEGDYVRTE
jgi:hypothetical protein